MIKASYICLLPLSTVNTVWILAFISPLFAYLAVILWLFLHVNHLSTKQTWKWFPCLRAPNWEPLNHNNHNQVYKRMGPRDARQRFHLRAIETRHWRALAGVTQSRSRKRWLNGYTTVVKMHCICDSCRKQWSYVPPNADVAQQHCVKLYGKTAKVSYCSNKLASCVRILVQRESLFRQLKSTKNFILRQLFTECLLWNARSLFMTPLPDARPRNAFSHFCFCVFPLRISSRKMCDFERKKIEEGKHKLVLVGRDEHFSGLCHFFTPGLRPSLAIQKYFQGGVLSPFTYGALVSRMPRNQ